MAALAQSKKPLRPTLDYYGASSRDFLPDPASGEPRPHRDSFESNDEPSTLFKTDMGVFTAHNGSFVIPCRRKAIASIAKSLSSAAAPSQTIMRVAAGISRTCTELAHSSRNDLFG